MNNTTGPDQLAALKSSRVVYEYTVPARLKEQHDGSIIETVGIVQLQAQEEIIAGKEAGADPTKLAWSLAKRCLWTVNGERVKDSDGSRDKFWNTMAPKLRSLCLTAYNDQHSPEPEDADAFLGSCAVTAQ